MSASADSELFLRLKRDARLDVDALVRAFRRETGSGDADRFLAWLHQNRRISDSLFVELAGGGEVGVARYRGVKGKTLLLEPPIKTLVLPDEEAPAVQADLAGDAGRGDAPTVPATALAEGAVPSAAPQPPPSAVRSPAQPLAAAVPSAGPPFPLEQGPGHSRYSLLGCLARGGMGEVHVARDEDLLRKVAYKKMVAEVAHSRELAARFFSEIQVTAQLDHPNIVPIYGLEVASDGALGYSMKLVQGKTLTSVLGEARRDGGGELAARLEIFLKVCDAIAYAHSKGVLHRDLKPDNVMVGRYNEVYVMDWGICRVIGSDNPEADKLELAPGIGAAAPSERTQYGAVIGTPAYMSPEQASGRNPELDGRSDVYALGLILFEVVSLRQAITGKQVLEVLGRAAIGDKDPLFGATHELRAIVAKATAADREQRYPTASALADDLRRVLRGEAPRCAPDNPLRRLARWVGRHRVAALVVIAALTALAGAVTIAVLLHAQQALARARGREQRVQALAAAVSQQAHAIDSQLHAAEALLFGLASQTAQLIEMPPAAELLAGTTIYFDEDYALAGHGPPDLAPSSYYRRPVSLASATVKLPPGVSREAVAAELRLVPALYRPLANVFFYAVGAEAKVAGPIVLATGGPLLDTFVTLESGVHVRYPGFGGYLPDYDGRQRAAYQLAAGKQGVFWGKPYLDRSGFGLILPVSASIYDPKGKLLGVCGAETTFRHIAAAILGLPGYPAVEREYLVDERARVVVQATARSGKIVEYGAAAHGQHGEQSKRGKDGKQSKDGDGSSGDGHADRPIDPQPLPFPAVAQAILAGRPSGVLTLGETLFAYQRFSAIGWYYVVQVSEQGLVSR